VSKIGLVGTPDHPIITPDADIPLAITNDRTILYIWNESLMAIERRSFTEAGSIIGISTQQGDNTAFIFGDMINGKSRLSRFIGKSGLIIVEKFQRGMLCITETATRLTTKLETLRYSLAGSTTRTTCLSRRGMLESSPTPEKMPTKPEIDLVSGRQTIQTSLKSFAERMLKSYSSQPGRLIASVAEACLFLPLGVLSIARSLAELGLQIATLLQKRRVYNLQVADSPEYFANNILVHNCMMSFLALLCMPAATRMTRNTPVVIRQDFVSGANDFFAGGGMFVDRGGSRSMLS
jgi:hypothetical protein